MVEGKQVAQPVRHAQHPLAHGDVRENLVDEVCRLLRHVPPAAARTEAPALAGEWDEPLEGAGSAAHAGEATGQDPAAEELSRLALDERREPVTVGTRCDLGEEGLEVIAHDAVQQALLARAGRVSEPEH